MERDMFASLSPLDHRYWEANQDLFTELSSYLSENAYTKYQLKVEAALVRALAERGVCPSQVAEEVEGACAAVQPNDVYAEERITRHNIRALVNQIRERVSDEAKPFVHLTATSADIMDTARALQYKDVTDAVLLPLLKKLMQWLIQMATAHKHTPQIGRTHGQHAVPITFGFYLSEYVSRLGGRVAQLARARERLPGKLAGAVGAYNAGALFFPDPEVFESEVLAQLGLRPAPYSTQVVEPEYLLDFVHALVSTFGVLANFSDDIRHLQRSEIGEVGEAFEPGQVGSSTMPHKRNPWNFEHVKSMWKEFMPRITTVYLDQISEHQRDLTNSASSRFVPEIVVGLAACVNRLVKVCGRLSVDSENMARNFTVGAKRAVAEPLYIVLAAVGHPDAHEFVKQLTLQADATNQDLLSLLEDNPEMRLYWDKLSDTQKEVIADPTRYLGIAARKTEQVCQYWQAALADVWPGKS